MSRIYIHHQREENYNNFQKIKKKCDKILWEKAKHAKINQCPSLTSQTFVNLVNSSKYHFKADKSQSNVPEYCTASNIPNTNDGCNIDYSILSSTKSHCKQTILKHKLTSMLDIEVDSKSADKITNNFNTLSCEITQLSKKIRPRLFYEGYSSASTNVSSIEFDKINGLACKTNKTLSLLAMDSLTYELIAERLGIELKESEFHTAAAIIDNEVSEILM